MKYIISCFSICIILITFLIWIKIDTRQNELEKETYIKLLQMQEHIEQQDKEIRILRQDIEILENGWDER